MTAPPGIDVVQRRLVERGIAFRRMRVGPDAEVLVSAYGARVYGPFFGGGPSESWLPGAFGDPDAFARLHASGAWNLGGDRLWIGPEIAYMIPDRARYWASYTMPPSLDPGEHVLVEEAGELVLRRHSRLAVHLPQGSGWSSIDLGLRLRPAPDPFALLPEGAPEGLAFAGHVAETTLSQTAADGVPAESWMLLQVHAGGTALVPGAAAMRVTDYYEPVGDLLSRIPGGSAVAATGADRFKIGFAAPHVNGRLGYLRELDDGCAVLFVRSSPVQAGLDYAEEPDFAPGARGDALHLYNDDGGLGGFAEMECRGTPVRGATARPAVDRFVSWWFRGPTAAVREAARQLLHLEPPYGGKEPS